jgi:hypothetical protein
MDPKICLESQEIRWDVRDKDHLRCLLSSSCSLGGVFLVRRCTKTGGDGRTYIHTTLNSARRRRNSSARSSPAVRSPSAADVAYRTTHTGPGSSGREHHAARLLATRKQTHFIAVRRARGSHRRLHLATHGRRGSHRPWPAWGRGERRRRIDPAP